MGTRRVVPDQWMVSFARLNDLLEILCYSSKLSSCGCSVSQGSASCATPSTDEEPAPAGVPLIPAKQELTKLLQMAGNQESGRAGIGGGGGAGEYGQVQRSATPLSPSRAC